VNTIVKSFYGSVSGNGDINGGGQVHGTACAEVVYDMAPDATLYLVNVSTVAEMDAAVHYLVDQGINIITHSVGWFNASFYDGTGPVSAIVDYATSNGVLWFNSAGNSAQSHWSGGFVDNNLDTFNEFAGNDQTLSITLVAGETVTVLLTWNDWPSSTNDYDIGFLDPSNALVAASVNTQTTGAFPPVEKFAYQAPTAGTYSIILQKRQANNPASQFHLFVLADGPDLLEYPVAAGSISDPAASPNSMAVGAVFYPSNVNELFSSQGPTSTGLRKPDISGPDGTSSFTYPEFFGTSAATPHAAGAAALIWSQNLTRNAATVRSLLETSASDLGIPGPDNVFGAGMVTLPSVRPVITGINPSTGSSGTVVSATISGTNLSGATAVFFSGTGVTATIGTGGTASTLPVTININTPSTGTRTVSVVTPAGTSDPFTGFTITSSTLPIVSAINPTTGARGTSFGATISGSNLAGASAVTFTGSGVTATIGTGGTATSLPVTIGIDSAATIGTRTFTVTTPSGTSAPFGGFTIVDSNQPTITAIAPQSGNRGDVLVGSISGTNLDGATAVTFSGSGVTATIGTGGTATNLPVTISISASASAGSRTVRVTTPNGTSPAFSGFTVNSAVVTDVVLTTSITPPQLPGTAVTFSAAPNGGVSPYQYKWFQFDGVSWTMLADWSANNTFLWTPTVANPNYRIGVWVRSSGNSTDAGEAVASQAFAILAALPVITGINPGSGAQGAQIAANISGTGLAGASAVIFSGSGMTATIEGGATDTNVPVSINISGSAPVGSRTVRVMTPYGLTAPFTGFTVTSSAVVSSVSLTSDVTPPQMAGTTVHWTATPVGGVAPHEYKWWLFDGQTWTLLANWSTNNTFAWTPTTANPNYRIGVWVRSAGNPADNAEMPASVAFPILAAPPAITGINPTGGIQGTSVPANISGSGLSGATAVTFSGAGVTAVIGSGGTPTSLPITINIAAGAAVGSRTFTVTTPAGTSAAFNGFTVNAPQIVTNVTLTSDLSPPQTSGTTITFTATPTGGIAPHEYKWWLFDGQIWTLLANWSTNNTFAWTPATANPNYRIGVWVRSAGNPADSPEIPASIAFPIAGVPTVTSVMLISDVPAPQTQGTTITFTATPSGGRAPQEYKWWLFDGQVWSILANWSTNNTFAWTPATANPNYRIGVWVRSAGNPADSPEIAASIAFPIAGVQTVTSVTLTSDVSAPQAQGTMITFTATPSGGRAPQEYKWWLFDGQTWTPVTNWSTNNTFVWTPIAANPNYRVGVWVRSAGNSADSPEVPASVAFPIFTPLL